MKNAGFSQLKVGHTTRSVYERAQELSAATGVPGKFTVLEHWYVPKDSAKYLERRIHQLLKARGKYFKKEFFNATHEDIRVAIHDVLSERDIAVISFGPGDSEREKLRQYEEFLAERSQRFRELREQDLREKRAQEETKRAEAREREILSEFDRLYWRALHKQNPVRLVMIPGIFVTAKWFSAIVIFFSLIAFVNSSGPPKQTGSWLIVLFLAYIFAYGGWDVVGNWEITYHVKMLDKLKFNSNFERKRFIVMGDIENGRLIGKTREQLVETLTKYYL